MSESDFSKVDSEAYLADILDHGLRSDYGTDLDFELLLHALETLEAFVGVRMYPGGHRHLNAPVIGAFAELMRRYESLNDETLLREARLMVLRVVHQHVGFQ